MTTIPGLLVAEKRWPTVKGPWGYGEFDRTYTARTMTMNDLCRVCREIGVVVEVDFRKREEA